MNLSLCEKSISTPHQGPRSKIMSKKIEVKNLMSVPLYETRNILGCGTNGKKLGFSMTIEALYRVKSELART